MVYGEISGLKLWWGLDPHSSHSQNYQTIYKNNGCSSLNSILNNKEILSILLNVKEMQIKKYTKIKAQVITN